MDFQAYWLQYVLPTFLAILGAYLIGSISFAYIIAKRMGGIDIREHGSGNAGATNVKRVLGSKAGLIVLILDFLKGLIPVCLVHYWLFPQRPTLHVVVAIFLLVGHSKSIFLGFKGGKSAITGLGGIFGLAPVVGLLLAVMAFTIFKITRTVSIVSLIACVVTPILLVVFNSPLPYTIYGLVSGLYIAYLHRSNIARLMKGEENKI